MKKVMFAAAAVAMFGAAQAACEYTPDPVKDTAWVYTWKFSGKTTEGALIKGVAGDTGVCGYQGQGTAAGFVRVPASLKIQGYTYYCTPACGDFEDALKECREVFYQTKPEKVSLSGGVTIEVAHIIGKKGKQYELGGTAAFDGAVDGVNGTDTFGYDLTFAGLGKYDQKNDRVSSVSGNFAGSLYPVWYVSNDICREASYWTCEDILATGDLEDSVAYGKFTVKFNKSAAKKYLEKGTWVKMPSWVKILNNTICK